MTSHVNLIFREHCPTCGGYSADDREGISACCGEHLSRCADGYCWHDQTAAYDNVMLVAAKNAGYDDVHLFKAGDHLAYRYARERAVKARDEAHEQYARLVSIPQGIKA